MDDGVGDRARDDAGPRSRLPPASIPEKTRLIRRGLLIQLVLNGIDCLVM
jgi:hypothetical protein